MGPEGGEEGGRVVAEGTPEQVAATPGSATGEFLAELVTADAAPRAGRNRNGEAKGQGTSAPANGSSGAAAAKASAKKPGKARLKRTKAAA
ncbi:MAG: hypothetical protein H0V81_06800, partial [Solirubrobacterales bacterium]|nr:hypothetical protein [Solirubrobacterales bacterium]